MAVYPDKPKRESGYTEKWIADYLDAEATPRQITRYANRIEGKDKKEARDIFIEMFIKKDKSLADKCKDIAKKKKEAAKAKKQTEEPAQE